MEEHNNPVGLTRHLARFVAGTRLGDMPPDIRSLGKKAILDTIGCGLAGSLSDGSRLIRNHIDELGCGAGVATVFGTKMAVSPRFAALANGTAIHSDDYDDSQQIGHAHSSGPVVAAVFADAERAGRSGADVLTAFNVGAEVTSKVSAAISPDHYERGFHATGTVGVFGATAGVCCLRGYSANVTTTALGIAGSLPAGLRENFGTMVKPLHTGRAAENGWFAAAMAGSGFTASTTILEGSRGFFAAGGGGYDPNVILDHMGKPWSYADPGVSVKPYPSGALTHPAMWKLQEFMVAHDIKPDQMLCVNVKGGRRMSQNLTYHHPKTGLEGKFSMEFCLAAILLFRRAGLSEFTDQVVTRQDVQDMMKNIHYTVCSDEEARTNSYLRHTALIEVIMKDGRRISGRADFAKGSPAIPMTEDEVADKFRDCAAFAGFEKQRSNRIVNLVLNLESVKNISELTGLLRAC